MLRSVLDIIADYDPGAALAEAKTIPAEWYTDARIAELERRTVFSRTWQLAGRVDQLTEPGDYVTTTVAGEPVVVVRGDDGALRGFFNVCRHHAAAVMTEPCGRAQSLRCPYHGWTYGLDGSLKATPELEGVQRFNHAENGLVPVNVATWEKLVFVHLDPDPRPIAEHVGRMAHDFASLGLDALHFYERRTFEIQCNWKVFVDNYLDGGYHVPFLHKKLNSVLDFKRYSIEASGRVCLQKSPINPSGAEEITSAVRRGEARYYWVYPNLMLNWYEGYLDTNLVIPAGVDRTLVIFDFYFTDTSPDSAARNRKSVDVSERIQDEDLAICESVQRGLSSRAYRAGRLSVRREAGEHLFHRLLHADLHAGLAPLAGSGQAPAGSGQAPAGSGQAPAGSGQERPE
jgi:choline monooxygenase